MNRSDGHHGGTRRRFLLLAALLIPALLLGDVTSARTTVKPAYSYAVAQSPDVVVAGGLDGRVYAVNAWSGEVLWSFDSGGPMVDSSKCLGVNPATSPEMPPNYHSASVRPRERAEADVDIDGSVHVATTSSGNEQVEDRSVIQQQSASSQAMAASEAFMAQLVPSYDGRLYHFSKSKVKELGMTMADIVNLNGPVRVAVDSTNTGDEPTVDASAADILLFGEKKLEMFTLDAVSGFRRPYSSPPTKAMTSEILFGRSEFTTRAVHPRNASSARCFKISEFFLDFAQQAHCSVGDSGHSMVPEILVMPKDPHSALEDEGSTIVAFDPWTSEQLWEFEVPEFDVLAVYGISTTRGATFYKWKVDGPSSTATRRTRIPAQVAGSRLEDQQHRVDASKIQDSVDVDGLEQDEQESQANKQLIQVVSRTWDTMESRFRLRMLGDNYFLESSKDENVADEHATHSPTFHRRQADNIHDFHEEMSHHRRRRILWEPIVNDGKRGVFITYTHVGAMLLGVATCGILLAWGCYVKGLSASLAQSAIKTMDQSQFFTSHVHRLTIQRPGEEDITISSVISRSLMMNALSVDGQMPLLENGEPMNILSTEVSAKVDPATEAMLMEKFSRLAANEAAAILHNGGHVGSKHKLLAGDPDADSNATTATSSSSASSLTDMIVRGVSASSSTVRISNQGSTFASRKRLALPYSGDNSLDEEDVANVYEVKMLSVSEDAEEFIAPPVDRVLDNERFEFADSDDDIFFDGEDSAATLNGAKSISSSGESTTGSCCSSSDSCRESDAKNKSNSSDAMREDETTDEKSSDEKSSIQESSEASSADSGSSTSEAEVLFPFVCQSRFVNEFEELSAIGKGGFGQVMLAENRLDGRKYAIKRVGLNLKNQTSKTLQKFLREVKILALLDHPNIVRYYQAWLEKVEESERGRPAAPSSVASDTSSFGGLAKAKNYSTSNLLAPISELEFSGNQRHLETFYSNGSLMSDNADDDGFDWDRGSTSGVDNDDGWKEEDLVVQNKPLSRNLPSRVSSSRSPGDHVSGEDSSFNAAEKCDHWLYIQMQYCAGRNLGDYLAVPTRPMELSRMLKIFVQIASALAHVHSCGLIHRDLKPANIFVADVDRDEIKLGDFGLSRYAANVNNLNAPASLDDSQQGPSSFNGLRETPLSTSMWSNMSESNEVTAGVGTYLYASPEQVAGKKYNAKTDIYSLGMILFELCHERFGTTMERYITLRDARDSKFPVDLRAAKRCPEILEMLRKLLSHDPSTRPTADEVVQWGQMMYETSLAQKAMDVVRSPRNLDMARAVAAHMIPGIDHLMTGGPLELVATTTFSLKVEAAMEHCSGEDGGERRLPNHNLLKQVCDVIAGVSNGGVEIKKCGLHMESEGVTILEFELDPQAALADAPGSDVEGSVVVAIEALAGVQIVHRVGKID
ncbi:Eukaryotic translation initiation factor 2-alpha kinase 1 [Phytophthora citrophthora]|uniref:non-specific serine/threonine protein kinase n=1 Tax=Phytophthora citrophthora TaxID=4793 RepID=A0AAD9FZ68_9STRA|nr:Eukaryotic translation initiation factor 2-alpha kinase 1 [Phytophthora citrophthora]